MQPSIITHLQVCKGAEDKLDLTHVRVQAQTPGLRAHQAQVQAHVAVASRLRRVVVTIQPVLDPDDSDLGVRCYALKAGCHAGYVLKDDALTAQVHQARVVLRAKKLCHSC